MEYIFELREELWNEKWEKILAVLLTIVLLSAVVTMSYDRVDMSRYGGIGESIEARNSIVALSETKIASVVDDVLMEGTLNIEEEPIAEIVTNAVEIPTEKMESVVAETSTEEFKNSATEVVIEKIDNRVVEAPIEKIENTVVEAPLEEIKNTVVEVPAEKIENIAAEAPVEENTNIVAEVPTDEIVNPVTEDTENSITEAAFMIDEAGLIYGFRPEFADLSNGFLEFPTEGCTGIRRGTFLGCSEWIVEIHIPSNITYIEDGAMTELCSLEYIVAEPGHPAFITVDGVLYDVAGTALLAYPTARVGAYFVPEQIQTVSENAFLNTSLSIIDIRGCGLSANCLLNISESCSIIE